ncbi:PREDICTED: uncharacterized protein LOC105313713 [Amphimedon queenslandica]|uniref:P2X purinoceptor 7-like n=2 Tax=Amphimedon queenslandica TaxID=400682 RepID=A0AAN0IPB7_AMPQE|nr:PREDICTED: uncharacterized protein LOC105313713 [Amphimedon queenslandica]|eukprot:XP_011405668.2 PREDICTED: uncharacterized protein LOC105313713 [Amphimedon queenslandica]
MAMSSSDSEEEIIVDESDNIIPYNFEPVVSDDDDDESVSSDSSHEEDYRISNTTWCSCTHCVVMQTQRECLCCRAVQKVLDKIHEADDHQVKCITEHPGFAPVCLNIWVLQAAYSQYRQQYGNFNAPVHERHRYTTYR